MSSHLNNSEKVLKKFQIWRMSPRAWGGIKPVFGFGL